MFNDQIKKFFRELFRFLNNDIWYLQLPRCVILLCLGTLIMLRPAVSLRICSWLLLFLAGTVVLFIYQKFSSTARHFSWLLPLGAVSLLLFPRLPDAAGIFFGAGLCLTTAARAESKNNLSSRFVAGTALAAALVFGLKSFTATWFDLYPAVSLSFFAAAVWESGNLKFYR